MKNIPKSIQPNTGLEFILPPPGYRVWEFFGSCKTLPRHQNGRPACPSNG
jgi:hypothetical protein